MMLHETRQENIEVCHLSYHYTERIKVSWMLPGAPCADKNPGSSAFMAFMAGRKNPEGFTYRMGVFLQGRLKPGRSCARLFIHSWAAFRGRRPLRTASLLISPKLRVQPPHIRSCPLQDGAECGRQQTERENHPTHQGHV